MQGGVWRKEEGGRWEDRLDTTEDLFVPLFFRGPLSSCTAGNQNKTGYGKI